MSNQKTYNVLVIEDEQPLFEAIRIKLEKNNMQVVSARSVQQALSLLSEEIRIDAIWLDHYLLGEETGLDFLAKIKSDGKLKELPVFVVSNTASSEKLSTYMSLGAASYYVKANYRIEQIIKEIRDYLESHN